MKCYACGKLGHISRYVLTFDYKFPSLTVLKVTALHQTVVPSTLPERLVTSVVRQVIFLGKAPCTPA
jgi:hypothetical protein